MNRRGKSRANDMLREELANMGLKPCPLCAVPGKWDIFHTAGNPCPKESAGPTFVVDELSGQTGGER